MTSKREYVLDRPIGMSTRDEFAKAAMQGFLAVVGPNTEADFDTIAQMAYDMAEAMMAERDKWP